MRYTGLSGTNYTLDPNQINAGGEGVIYSVASDSSGSSDKKVAKIYMSGIATKELEEKLTIMVNRPPNSKVLSQVAWPLDVIYDNNRKFQGFIMPHLNINSLLSDVYKYPAKINVTYFQKVGVAKNICAVISEVHKAGYVFGDFNPLNIGLDKNTGLVSFLDTDTYHVFDQSKGKWYRCNVCAAGYAAPELLKRCSDHVANNPNDKNNVYAKTPIPTFEVETDNFALAVHIFKLLMNGYTPYGGIIETVSASQGSPGIGDAAVRRDNYCFKPGFKHQSTAILPLSALPQDVSVLFTRAFIDGRSNPKMRPTAADWFNALDKFEKLMVTCAGNQLHQYDGKNASCPLCEADARYNAVMGIQPSVAPMTQTPFSGTSPPVVGTPSATVKKNPHPPQTAPNVPVRTKPQSPQPAPIYVRSGPKWGTPSPQVKVIPAQSSATPLRVPTVPLNVNDKAVMDFQTKTLNVLERMRKTLAYVNTPSQSNSTLTNVSFYSAEITKIMKMHVDLLEHALILFNAGEVDGREMMKAYSQDLSKADKMLHVAEKAIKNPSYTGGSVDMEVVLRQIQSI